MMADGRVELSVDLFGARFRNPILLASGTCGFGEEVHEVIDLGALGGLVTKSVTLEPRAGNPAPRVAEFEAGMMNSIGLANPGARTVAAEKLPWIRDHLDGLQVFVSVAGNSPEAYWEVVEILDGGPGFLGFELNLSCPNDRSLDALPFALDSEMTRRVVAGVRERTNRPVLAKLAPNTPDWRPVIEAVESAGANGVTLVNTLPGILLDGGSGPPVLGAGHGGVSGPALRPVGLQAVRTVARLTRLPLVGVGGIARGADALAYLSLGASLVEVGTASFWDPRTAPRVVDELRRLAVREGVSRVSDLVGRANPARSSTGG